jgi:peptidoglycan LD-endopeptidase CwlK
LILDNMGHEAYFAHQSGIGIDNMILLEIGVYFLVACALAALVLLPDFREQVFKSMGGAGSRWWLRRRSQGQQLDQQLRGYGAQVRSNGAHIRKGLRKHRLVLMGGLALVLLPPIGVVLLRSRLPALADEEPPAIAPDPVALALLQGEQLVPPAPLPPEAFTTAEVMSIRPEVVNADRHFNQLEAQFEQRLLLVYKLMRQEHGYEMVMLEGYRSPERQNELAKLGPHVTNARAWQSYHQYGLAADSAFLRGGKIVISERDPWAMKGYELYGQVAERVGLKWGGRWKMADLGHIESRQPRPDSHQR